MAICLAATALLKWQGDDIALPDLRRSTEAFPFRPLRARMNFLRYHFGCWEPDTSKNYLAHETGFKRLPAKRFFSFFYAPVVWGLRVLPEMFRRPYSTEEIVAREAAFHRCSRSRGDLALERLHRFGLVRLNRGGTLTAGTSLSLVLESPG